MILDTDIDKLSIPDEQTIYKKKNFEDTGAMMEFLKKDFDYPAEDQ
jgi:hypothetical protein